MMGFRNAEASAGPYANSLHLTADIVTMNSYGFGSLLTYLPMYLQLS